jgi:hypothetical protein
MIEQVAGVECDVDWYSLGRTARQSGDPHPAAGERSQRATPYEARCASDNDVFGCG